MPSTIRRCVLAVVVSLLAATPLTAQTQDVKGSKDHPLISRYPGSIIREYVQKEYDEFLLPLGKAVLGKFEKAHAWEER
jgi:OmpA-OmpF porin, OOP family